MVCDAVVAKINDDGEDKIFIFFLDPKTDTIKDGLNLEDISEIYDNLPYDTLMVVEAVLKDGTKDVDIDMDEFIGGKYGKYDIFIHIKDLMPFRLGQRIDENSEEVEYKTIKQVIFEGEFPAIAKNCIQQTREELSKQLNEDNEDV